jgi:hypothetical protein
MPESAMTKPSNERRELNRSTQELRATELDLVVGGMSKVVKSASDTRKAIIQNIR